jgi:hypothetical protein
MQDAFRQNQPEQFVCQFHFTDSKERTQPARVNEFETGAHGIY